MFSLNTTPPEFTSLATWRGEGGIEAQGDIVSQNLPSVPDSNPDWFKYPLTSNPTQFYPEKIVKVNITNIILELVPGYVWYDDPPSADSGSKGWKYTMPEFAGVPLNDKPRPQFTVAVNQSIYARVERNYQGLVTGVVTMIVAAENADPAHYQPQDDLQVGIDGQYEDIEILTVKDDGTGKLYIEQKHSGPITFMVTLVGANNLGGGARPHKQFNRTALLHEFRTHQDLWGHSIAENGDTIEHKLKLQNAGSGVAILKTEAEVAGNPDPKMAQLRTLTQGPTNRQQLVVDVNGDNIRFYGNGANGSIDFQDCYGNSFFTLTWVDGFITSSFDDIAKLAACPSNPIP